MRIIFLTGQFPKVSETFVLNQVTGLIDLGVDVKIVSLNPSTDPIPPSLEHYHLLDRIEYVHFPKTKFLFLSKAFWMILKHLNHPFKLWRAINPFKYGKQSITNLFILEPFFHSEFDVIYAHFGDIGKMGVFLKNTFPNSKLVTVFHGYDMTIIFLKHGDHFYDSLFEKADLLLPISQYWRNILIEKGANPEKIQVHHMGVDLSQYKFTFDFKSKEAPFKILSIGRLVEKKAHYYSIKAIMTLLESGLNLEYHIIGDGPEEDALKQLAKDQEKIIFHGRLSEIEKNQLLQDCQIFLLPSITAANGDKEGIPVSLMEAMAMGLVVVSTNHSGIPELIEDKKDGLLSEERNINELANNIRYLVKHPTIWQDMVNNAYQKVKNEFNVENLNQQLTEILQKMLMN